MDQLSALQSASAALAKAQEHVIAAIAALTADTDSNVSAYRINTGGNLSAAGVAEIERRFARGESNSTIAVAMDVSIGGVQARRTMWKKKQKTTN